MDDAANKVFGDDAAIVYDAQFQLLVAANLIGVLGAALISPILDTLVGTFDVSTAHIGLMMSVFTAPPILIIPLAGALADRYGRKPILIAGLTLFGAAGAAIALTTDFRVVLALRFLQGIGFAGIVPLIITSIGDLYTGTSEATAQGLRFTTSGISMMIFPLLAGSIVVLGWQYPFLLFGAAIPIAVLLYVFLDEPTPTRGVDERAREASGVRQLRGIVTQPRVLAIVLARGVPNIAWTAFLTYISIVVVQLLDGTSQQAGLLVSIGSAMFALSASQTGRLSAISDSRLWPLVGANVMLALGSTLIAFGPLVLVVVGVTVLGLGFGIAMSVYRSVITGYAPPKHRGGLVSLAESFGRITATMTPIVMGVAIANGTELIGFVNAVRWTFAAISVGGGLVGTILLGVASRSPPVRG